MKQAEPPAPPAYHVSDLLLWRRRFRLRFNIGDCDSWNILGASRVDLDRCFKCPPMSRGRW